MLALVIFLTHLWAFFVARLPTAKNASDGSLKVGR
jgi:hypothetical protein